MNPQFVGTWPLVCKGESFPRVTQPCLLPNPELSNLSGIELGVTIQLMNQPVSLPIPP